MAKKPKKWTLSPAQHQLITAKTDVGNPEQMHNWDYQRWTPGKRLVGRYLGELHHPRQRTRYREAGLIAGDGTLLYFALDLSDLLNLAQALKPVPFGAPVKIDCDTKMVKDQLVFRVKRA
jgi:hypothetical protein